MKKWGLAAIAYLLLVMGGYTVYSQSLQKDNESKNEHATAGHGEAETHSDENDGAHGEHGGIENSETEVEIKLDLDKDDLKISIQNIEGEQVDDLEINHEKLLHLIIVSTDLEHYYHLHPDKVGPGLFELKHNLPNGNYKAFIDIKPSNLSYHVEPISFGLGEETDKHEHTVIEPSSSFSLENGSHKVTLKPSSLELNEKIELSFDLNGETPEQYLGALGHVVILDEHGENYIHVHPLEGEIPIFATSFSQAGLYKVWAEFQFNGEVVVFPYVIEIK